MPGYTTCAVLHHSGRYLLLYVEFSPGCKSVTGGQTLWDNLYTVEKSHVGLVLIKIKDGNRKAVEYGLLGS